MRRGSMLMLALSIVVIVAATMVPTPGSRGPLPVSWCMTCGPMWMADAISNVVLFVPFGAALVLLGMRPARAVLLGSLVSLVIELLQSRGVPSGRNPALSDWVMNSIGAGVGAFALATRAWWLWPSPARARVLLSAWIVLCVAGYAACTWLLTPISPSVGATTSIVPSPLPFTPGFGWYSARADSALVNGVRIPHGGTGPVIVEMSRTDMVRVSVHVRGRDSRRSLVPIVYVHASDSRSAYAILGQRGDHVVLRPGVYARRWGLIAPELAIDRVFSAGGRADSVPVVLRATVTTNTLTLEASDGGRGGERRAALTLSPLIAWVMFQTVVRLDSSMAPFVTLMWVLAWLTPIVWWTAAVFDIGRSSRRTAEHVATTTKMPLQPERP